jgi:hypothetical protein
MKQIKFDLSFKDRILSGEKTITIRKERELEANEDFEVIFVKDGEVIESNIKILAKCTQSYEVFQIVLPKKASEVKD